MRERWNSALGQRHAAHDQDADAGADQRQHEHARQVGVWMSADSGPTVIE